MDDAITRREHEEFAKRIEAEEDRQNHRLANLESTIAEINRLTTSVEKLATNMSNMVTEQKDQGDRLKVLEDRDGAMWRSVVSHIIMLIIGAIVTGAITRFGI